MADSACYIELASNAGDFFTNATQDDILIHPQYATQKILLGTSNSQIPSITVTSNAIGILQSSPSYTLDVQGDINFTGSFFENGTPYIGSQWSNNNSNVFLGTNSNVGIGKSNPAYPLDVIGDINYTGTFRKNGTPYVGSQWSNSDSNVFLGTNSNVGIGIITPENKLDVRGSTRINNPVGQSAEPALTLENSNSTNRLGLFVNLGTGSYGNVVSAGDSGIIAGLGASDTGSLILGVWGSNNAGIKVDKTGHIGIGTASPSYKLDVTGQVRATNIISQTSTTGDIGALKVLSTSGGTPSFWMGFCQGSATDNNDRARIGTVIKPGGAGSIYFTTGSAGAQTEAVRIDEVQNVGIGTTTPSYKLDVAGTARSIVTSGRSSTYTHNLNLGCDVSTGHFYWRNSNLGINISDSSNDIVSTKRHLIINEYADSTCGFVGIGISNPGYKLDVAGTTRVGATGTNTSLHIGDSTYSNTQFPRFISALDSTISVGERRGIGFGKASTFNNSAELVYIHTGDGSTANRIDAGLFGLTCMSIVAGGNVGIGTSNPVYKLHVNGDINYTGSLYKSGVALAGSQWTSSACNVYVGSTSNVGIGTTAPQYTLHVVGTIYTTGDIIAFSDETAKSNLEVISEPLSKVHGLTGYTYNMIETVSDRTKLTSKYTGLIAQQVMQVLPEAVHKDTDGKLSIAYGNIMGLVVEAIKAIDNKYKEEIQTLKNQMAQVLAKS